MRLAALIALCQSGRRYLPPLSELAVQHQCSKRTIRRDLEALEAAGIAVPIWRHEDHWRYEEAA